jgi:hypothetical protein
MSTIRDDYIKSIAVQKIRELSQSEYFAVSAHVSREVSELNTLARGS